MNKPKPKYCEYCHDGCGQSVYPYTGREPEVTETIYENFVYEENSHHVGTYTHCLKCGAGKDE